MNVAQVLNPINLNAIHPWGIPVRHLPALFRYLLNTYDHSLLKVFIISRLILNNFQPFCFSVMPFPDTPNITQKSFTFFSIWYIFLSYIISIEFCVHLLLINIKYPILFKLFIFLLISFHFSTFYNQTLPQLLSHSV